MTYTECREIAALSLRQQKDFPRQISGSLPFLPLIFHQADDTAAIRLGHLPVHNVGSLAHDRAGRVRLGEFHVVVRPSSSHGPVRNGSVDCELRDLVSPGDYLLALSTSRVFVGFKTRGLSEARKRKKKWDSDRSNHLVEWIAGKEVGVRENVVRNEERGMRIEQ